MKRKEMKTRSFLLISSLLLESVGDSPLSLGFLLTHSVILLTRSVFLADPLHVDTFPLLFRRPALRVSLFLFFWIARGMKRTFTHVVFDLRLQILVDCRWCEDGSRWLMMGGSTVELAYIGRHL